MDSYLASPSIKSSACIKSEDTAIKTEPDNDAMDVSEPSTSNDEPRSVSCRIKSEITDDNHIDFSAPYSREELEAMARHAMGLLHRDAAEGVSHVHHPFANNTTKSGNGTAADNSSTAADNIPAPDNDHIHVAAPRSREELEAIARLAHLALGELLRTATERVPHIHYPFAPNLALTPVPPPAPPPPPPAATPVSAPPPAPIPAAAPRPGANPFNLRRAMPCRTYYESPLRCRRRRRNNGAQRKQWAKRNPWA